MEELELVWVCCGWLMLPTAHSNQRQIAVTVWLIPDVVDTVVWLLMMGDGTTRKM
jgi:uncharacterized membrane protein YozB (DUF420 family)